MIKKYPIRNKSGKEQYIITSTLNERAVCSLAGHGVY